MKEAPTSRQAERQALRGGHVNSVVRGDWGRPSEQPPLLDEESTRFPSARKSKRKKEPKRERCEGNPNGHTHEWMKDTVEVPLYLVHWQWYSDRSESLIGSYELTYRLCAHCDRIQWRQNGKWVPTASERRRKRGRLSFPTQARCYRKGDRVYLGSRWSIF